MVDRDLVLRKLADLQLYLSQIAEYRDTSAERYRNDWKTQRIVERTLQIAIEAAVDVAAHVIADRKLRVPSTYAETFEILGEAGLLDAALAASLARMARFRNLLVHQYTRLDAEIVVSILREDVSDLTRFSAVARGWA